MRETDRCIVTPSAGPVRPSPFKSSAADMDKPEWGMQIDSYSMLYGSYLVLLLYTGLRSVSKLLVKLAFSVDGKRSSRRCNVKLYRKARSSTKPRASESAIWCPNVGTLPIRTALECRDCLSGSSSFSSSSSSLTAESFTPSTRSIQSEKGREQSEKWRKQSPSS